MSGTSKCVTCGQDAANVDVHAIRWQCRSCGAINLGELGRDMIRRESAQTGKTLGGVGVRLEVGTPEADKARNVAAARQIRTWIIREYGIGMGNIRIDADGVRYARYPVVVISACGDAEEIDGTALGAPETVIPAVRDALHRLIRKRSPNALAAWARSIHRQITGGL